MKSSKMYQENDYFQWLNNNDWDNEHETYVYIYMRCSIFNFWSLDTHDTPEGGGIILCTCTGQIRLLSPIVQVLPEIPIGRNGFCHKHKDKDLVSVNFIVSEPNNLIWRNSCLYNCCMLHKGAITYHTV